MKLGALSMDPGRALLAVALACALWIVIQNDENPDRTSVTEFRVPVEVVNAPPNLVAVGDPPSVQVRVRVPIDVWPRLRPSMFRATVDAVNVAAGTNEVPVAIERLDSSIRSAEASPSQATVIFEEIREVSVPVRVNVIGSVPFGYVNQQPRVLPERISITGPSSRVSRADAAVIDVRLDGVTVNVDGGYSPRLLDNRGSELTRLRITPSTVNVTIEVSQQVAYKEVGVRPKLSSRVASGYFIDGLDTEPAAVTVVGDPQALASVDYVETQPIDVSNMSSGGVRRAALAPPRGVGLVQAQPVTVTIRVTPIETSQIVRITPSVQGLGTGIQISGEIPPLDLTIRGQAPSLRALTVRDFSAVLNVSGLEPGTHALTPVVTVPSGVQIDAVEPAQLSLTLRAAPGSPVDAPSADVSTGSALSAAQ